MFSNSIDISMKQLILGLLLLVMGYFVSAQSPVKWSSSCRKINKDTYQISIVATIDDEWHVYSQVQPRDAIASPTIIRFPKNPLYTLIGKTEENGELKVAKIETLGITQNQYNEKVEFLQTLRLKYPVKIEIPISIFYQTCTDEQCLPVMETSVKVQIN